MKKISYIKAINEALFEEMDKDEKVFMVGESIRESAFGASKGLVDKFGPDRVMDTPISETAIAGIALGSAQQGYRPVADFMFADFMYVAMDEIVDKAAKFRYYTGGMQSLPLVFMAAMGGYLGAGPGHSQSPVSYYMHTPGLRVVVPSTPYDAKGLMKTAIRDNNPVIYFYHKALLGTAGDVPEEEYVVPLGQADIKREGDDVTIVATGMMVHFALNVAEQLKDKASIEVVDPRCLEPLDMDTIVNSVKKPVGSLWWMKILPDAERQRKYQCRFMRRCLIIWMPRFTVLPPKITRFPEVAWKNLFFLSPRKLWRPLKR